MLGWQYTAGVLVCHPTVPRLSSHPWCLQVPKPFNNRLLIQHCYSQAAKLAQLRLTQLHLCCEAAQQCSLLAVLCREACAVRIACCIPEAVQIPPTGFSDNADEPQHSIQLPTFTALTAACMLGLFIHDCNTLSCLPRAMLERHCHTTPAWLLQANPSSNGERCPSLSTWREKTGQRRYRRR